MNPAAGGLPDPVLTGGPGRAPVAAADAPRGAETGATAGGLDSQALLERIGARLECAEGLLLRPSPQNAAQLIIELEECCQLLASAGPLWRRQGSSAPDGGERLPWRSQLQRLETLTAGAAAFCQGWAAAAGFAAGYSASGASPLDGAGGTTLNQTG